MFHSFLWGVVYSSGSQDAKKPANLNAISYNKEAIKGVQNYQHRKNLSNQDLEKTANTEM